MIKKNIAVIFGGRSVEHEISIITACQIMDSLNRIRYNVVPIYITREGKWLIANKKVELIIFSDKKDISKHFTEAFLSPDSTLHKPQTSSTSKSFFARLFPKKFPKIDIVFPALHGTFGEDGTLQGLLELMNIPYVGSNVLASAIGMDKIIMKAVFKEYNLPVVNYIWFTRNNIEKNRDDIISQITSKLKYPLFVKPASLGSSIGISRAENDNELNEALEVAICYDRRILIEEAVNPLKEINCSVLGFEKVLASTLEEPLGWQEFLSYEDKYLSDGSKSEGMKSTKRRIPADISDELTKQIQDLAKKSFKALDCSGVARIDFLLNTDTEEVYINEINTLPGSLSFYLWEPSGIPFFELLDRLVDLALDIHKEKNRNRYEIDTPVLTGLKAGKM